MKTRTKGIALATSGCVLWGASGIAGQYLLIDRNIASEWLTFCRLFSAGILLLIITMCKGDSIWQIWKQKKDRMLILIFGVLGMLFTQYGYFTSIKYSNAPTATVIEYLVPLLIIGWTCISERRWPKVVEIICTALAFFGTVLVATKGDFTTLAVSPKALFWGLVAALACALYTIEPVDIIKKYGASIVVGWGMLVASLAMAPWMGYFPFTGTIDGAVLGAFGFVVLFGTICSFVLYLGSTKYITPAEVSIIAALEPLSSIIFAFILFGTVFSLMEWIGIVLIIGAVGVVAQKQ